MKLKIGRYAVDITADDMTCPLGRYNDDDAEELLRTIASMCADMAKFCDFYDEIRKTGWASDARLIHDTIMEKLEN